MTGTLNAPDIASPSTTRRRRRSSRIGAGALIAMCLLTVACSSSDKGKETNSPVTSASGSRASSSSTETPSSATPSTPATSRASNDQITGTWNGTYASKKYPSTSGTFTVVFTQQGDTIAGTISVDGGPVSNISGKLSGHTIKFGAIQSSTTTFDGSFAGNAMSGSYKSGTDSGNDNGTWQATR